MTHTPLNPQIWIDTWHRASHEEIGLLLEVDNPTTVYQYLSTCRPIGFEDYTLTRTSIENVIIIVRPGVTLDL